MLESSQHGLQVRVGSRYETAWSYEAGHASVSRTMQAWPGRGLPLSLGSVPFVHLVYCMGALAYVVTPGSHKYMHTGVCKEHLRLGDTLEGQGVVRWVDRRVQCRGSDHCQPREIPMQVMAQARSSLSGLLEIQVMKISSSLTFA